MEVLVRQCWTKIGKTIVLIGLWSNLGMSSSDLLACKIKVEDLESPSAQDLVHQYPDDFSSINSRLIITNGKIEDSESRAALKIAATLERGSVLVLTPSVFGYVKVPAIDGVIYDKSGPVRNISIKTITLDIGTNPDLEGRLNKAKYEARKKLRKSYSLATFARANEAIVTQQEQLQSWSLNPYNKKKDQILNKVVKFLGLHRKYQRPVTVAINLESNVGSLDFEITDDILGESYLYFNTDKTPRGPSHHGINLSRLVWNVGGQEIVEQYIFAGQKEVIYVDKNGFKRVPLELK